MNNLVAQEYEAQPVKSTILVAGSALGKGVKFGTLDRAAVARCGQGLLFLHADMPACDQGTVQA